MSSIVTYLVKMRYLRSHVVLAMDIILSVLASILCYAMINPIKQVTSQSDFVLQLSLAALGFSTVFIYLSGLHRDIIRYFSIRSILKIVIIAAIKSLGMMILCLTVWHLTLSISYLAPFVDFLLTSFLLIVSRASMIGLHHLLIGVQKTDVQNALLYGTTDKNPLFAEQVNSNPNSRYKICAFLTSKARNAGMCIGGKNIYLIPGSEQELDELFERYQIQSLIFSSYKRLQKEEGHLVDYCIKRHIKMMVSEVLIDSEGLDANGRYRMKPVQIEDLLNRNEIKVDKKKIYQEIKDDVILVTGAAGSIGSEIANQLAHFGVKQLILLDAAETPMHNLKLNFEKKHKEIDIVYKIGDVRCKERIESVMSRYKPSIVFHAAAYKHVPMMESNPCESIITNVGGTLLMANQAIRFGVRKFVMISTDKVVNPTNIMGATKRLAEMYVQGMNGTSDTQFITTRFGNVLGSNGSVIPLFKKQIEEGGPLTVTDARITRYFMTIPEACRLVLQAATIGHAGEILVFDMGQPEKIVHLAEKMICLSGLEPDKDIKISFTGLRPGEKLYEELLTPAEETQATSHAKIRIANSVKIDPDALYHPLTELLKLAKHRQTLDAVALLKALVPEYITNNNPEFEKLDAQKKEQAKK